MDKFIIKTTRQYNKTPKHEDQKIYKQLKLQNLKGVVVIEDLEKAKILLERNDVEAKLKVETLTKLSQKLPSKEVLINTNLGKIVHKLCRDADTDIALAAKKVYDTWKQNIISKVGKPSIEVRCDRKTEDLRKKARNLIYDAFKYNDIDKDSENIKLNQQLSSNLKTGHRLQEDASQNDLENLAEYIEREVFSKTKRKADFSYKRTNRKIVFVLKFQKDVKDSVLNGKLSVQQLVKTYFQQ